MAEFKTKTMGKATFAAEIAEMYKLVVCPADGCGAPALLLDKDEDRDNKPTIVCLGCWSFFDGKTGERLPDAEEADEPEPADEPAARARA